MLILWWIEINLKWKLFVKLNIITVTFDQFNASLMNKSINLIQTQIK